MAENSYKAIIVYGTNPELIEKRVLAFIKHAKAKRFQIIESTVKTYREASDLVATPDFFSEKCFYIFRNLKFESAKLKDLIEKRFNDETPNFCLFIFNSAIPQLKSFNDKRIKVESFGNVNEVYRWVQSILDTPLKQLIVKLTDLEREVDLNFIFFVLCDFYSELSLFMLNPQFLKTAPWKQSIYRRFADKLNLQSVKKNLDYLSELDMRLKTSQLTSVNSALLLALKQLKS